MQINDTFDAIRVTLLPMFRWFPPADTQYHLVAYVLLGIALIAVLSKPRHIMVALQAAAAGGVLLVLEWRDQTVFWMSLNQDTAHILRGVPYTDTLVYLSYGVAIAGLITMIIAGIALADHVRNRRWLTALGCLTFIAVVGTIAFDGVENIFLLYNWSMWTPPHVALWTPSDAPLYIINQLEWAATALIAAWLLMVLATGLRWGYRHRPRRPSRSVAGPAGGNVSVI